MVMLKEGLNSIRDLHAGAITSAQMGTDGTAPSESQTGLQFPITASLLAATVTKEDKTNVVNYTLDSTVATTFTMREFELTESDGTSQNRVTFTGIEHTDNEDIVVRQTIFYRNP